MSQKTFGPNLLIIMWFHDWKSTFLWFSLLGSPDWKYWMPPPPPPNNNHANLNASCQFDPCLLALSQTSAPNYHYNCAIGFGRRSTCATHPSFCVKSPTSLYLVSCLSFYSSEISFMLTVRCIRRIWARHIPRRNLDFSVGVSCWWSVKGIAQSGLPLNENIS